MVTEDRGDEWLPDPGYEAAHRFALNWGIAHSITFPHIFARAATQWLVAYHDRGTGRAL